MNKISIIAIAITMSGAVAANTNNTWTGFYVGINEGFAFNNVRLNAHQLGFTSVNETCNTKSDFSSYFPGAQLGFLYSLSNDLVAGLEANVTFNMQQKAILDCHCPQNPTVSDRFLFKNRMQSFFKGRLGRSITWNKGALLPYLTAGAGFAHVALNYTNEGGDYYSKDSNQTGALFGAGIEWSLMQNCSVRAEYSYVDYRNNIKLAIPSVYALIDPNGSARASLNTNNIQLAINYWI